MARKKVSFSLNPLLSGPSLASRASSGSPYRELPVGEVDVDPDQPRRVFDTEALAELAASIKEHGVLCPILVRVGESGTYRLVSGERRLRAAKLAGLSSIPAVIDSNEESETSTLAKQLVENMQRQDLTAMERALAIGQLRDTFQLSFREIAKRLGVSKGVVQRSLDVLNLPDDLQAALIEGASESKILVIGQVKDRALRKELLQLINDLTREELEQRIREGGAGGESSDEKVYRGGTKRGAGRRVSAEDTRLASDLQRLLGTRVQVLRRRGKPQQGRLLLEFYSNDDLKEIVKRLMGDFQSSDALAKEARRNLS